MKPVVFVTVLLAIGLIWWVGRRGSNESLDAIHSAFEDCVGKYADLDKIKDCVADQLKSRGAYWYLVDTDSLTIQNFLMPTKAGPAPGDLSVICRRLPRPNCSP
jgi:hypothetical protein